MDSLFKQARVVALASLVLLAGCGTSTIKSAKFHLPKKAAPDSAMVIGHIGLPDNEQLDLRKVVFTVPNKFYWSPNTMPGGEKDYVMGDTNNYVIPNLKPGKYYLSGFVTGKIFNRLPENKDTLIVLKPGQILYLGSLEYLEIKQSFFSKYVGKPGSYQLRLAKQPSELEILEWLSHVDQGSGWERAINHRIKQLGGKS